MILIIILILTTLILVNILKNAIETSNIVIRTPCYVFNNISAVNVYVIFYRELY